MIEDVDIDRFSVMTVRVPELLEEVFGISRSQARQFIKDGAFRIEGEAYTHLTCSQGCVEGKIIQIGKRRWARVKIDRRGA